MQAKQRDTVVLDCDMADCGLMRGDIGAVVQICSSDATGVEFIMASGKTRALVTLTPAQIRTPGADDMPAVRQVSVM